jgi:hypothetical protein
VRPQDRTFVRKYGPAPLIILTKKEKKEKPNERNGRASAFIFISPGNYQVLEEFLTAKLKKSKKFRYKVSLSLPSSTSSTLR